MGNVGLGEIFFFCFEVFIYVAKNKVFLSTEQGQAKENWVTERAR